MERADLIILITEPCGKASKRNGPRQAAAKGQAWVGLQPSHSTASVLNCSSLELTVSFFLLDRNYIIKSAFIFRL